MNPILGTGFGFPVPVDPGELASQAIVSNNIGQLQGQLDTQNVDLNTLNAQGVTLLMEAVRQHNPDALLMLLENCLNRGIVPDLMHRDHQNNTVLHYMAMHLPDTWFDVPSEEPQLGAMLEQLFQNLREDFDWERHNAQSLTAVELAQNNHKDNLVGFLQTFEVLAEDTSGSDDLESFH